MLSVSIADGDFNLIDRRQRFFVLFMRPAIGRLLCAGQAVRINITSSLRLTLRRLGGRGPRKTQGPAARSGNAQLCNSWFSVYPILILSYVRLRRHMPRILPRLIEKINSQGALEKWTPSPLLKAKKKAKSLYKRVPPRPSFEHSAYPRSILLESGNPVVNAKDWERHKTLPPTLSRPSAANTSQNNSRQMTEAEFGWWANPYRMWTPSAVFGISHKLLIQ